MVGGDPRFPKMSKSDQTYINCTRRALQRGLRQLAHGCTYLHTNIAQWIPTPVSLMVNRDPAGPRTSDVMVYYTVDHSTWRTSALCLMFQGVPGTFCVHHIDM
eukprot:6486514-Amphidinium_carterae.1